jgi:hypothetical protein
MRSVMAITIQQPASPADPTYGVSATDEVIERTADAIRGRGFEVFVVDDREHAKALILGMIPGGAEASIGSTQTIDELGVRAAIEESGRYDALRTKLRSMDRVTQLREMRKMAAAPDFMLNSAQAVTEDGRIVLGSFSGSQIGPVGGSAGKVILAVGSQKIVPDLAAALRRLEEYCLPSLEAAYGPPERAQQGVDPQWRLPGASHRYSDQGSHRYLGPFYSAPMERSRGATASGSAFNRE